MNVTGDVTKQVIEGLRSTPAMLALMLMNVIMLAGFWYVLSSISSAMERREGLLKSCIERTA